MVLITGYFLALVKGEGLAHGGRQGVAQITPRSRVYMVIDGLMRPSRFGSSGCMSLSLHTTCFGDQPALRSVITVCNSGPDFFRFIHDVRRRGRGRFQSTRSALLGRFARNSNIVRVLTTG